VLVQNGQVRFHPFPFFVSIWHGNAAGYRTRKRESAPATISGCCIFLVPKPSCPTFAGPGNGRQDHLKTNAAGRTSASASHARMTMTLAGLLSRRHESVAFPLSVALPFVFFLWRIAPSHTLSLFLSASPKVCQCSHAAIPDGISGHFRCRGKGNSGIVRGCKVGPPCGCLEKSPPSQAQVVFCPANLASPNPDL
jgi:hypothetical protein